MHFGKDHAEFMLSMYRREWEDPDKIIKQLPIGPGSDIVDLGCGPGFFTIPLAKETDGKVYAIDASDEMIDILKGRIDGHSNVIPIKSRAEKLPLPDHSADLVFIANAFHDFDDKDAVLDEIYRVLRDDGYLVDIDWKKEPSTHGPPMDIRIDRKEALLLISSHNFEIIKEIETGNNHYGLLFQKR
ncbi:class I SAM-dependent methyltransferase [Thermoplasma sp. Kam2015]|uniref:class I SAM-dependent methyltransferase n=1 Tax=Thermoplasma sp. Kam2015 TaxID=2094122 RepID=UPI000D99CF63|nr:class I SAM-dependent methyltransferase [Thermoplasma sp. Kam2015]PYB68359.1 class I SAM-dependent methyltransferase [Thermoplasma sp. Kam2015]